MSLYGGASGHYLPAGTRLNNLYEIERVVGEGGMGVVYRGRAIETGDAVAIKVIRADMAGNESALALFRKEASVLNNLLHEAIVRYYVFSRDPDIDRPYLATEFVDGVALHDIIDSEALSRGDVIDLTIRLAEGLQAAHRLGVIHRDISPDNVILPDGDVRRAKIIDFGIARATQFGGKTVIGDSIAGKFDYMSPEQLGLYGGNVTPRSDMYSLAVVLAEAALGRPLNMGGSQAEVIEKRRAVPNLDGIEPRLRGLLTHMLQPKPQDRPETMTEIAVKARAIAGAAPRRSRRGPLIAASVALIVVAVGAGLYGADALRLFGGPDPVEEETAEALNPAPLVAAPTLDAADDAAAGGGAPSDTGAGDAAPSDTGAGGAAPSDTGAGGAAPGADPSAERELAALGVSPVREAPQDAASAGEAQSAAPEPPAPDAVEPAAPELRDTPTADAPTGDGDGDGGNAGIGAQTGGAASDDDGVIRLGGEAVAPETGDNDATPPASGAETPATAPAAPQGAGEDGPFDTAALDAGRVGDDPPAQQDGATGAPTAGEPAGTPGSAAPDAGDGAVTDEAEDTGPTLANVDDGSIVTPQVLTQPGAGVERYVRQYDAGDCTYIRPTEVAERYARLEGFGDEVPPFVQFDQNFARSMGFEADIGLRLVKPAQCPAVEFIRQLKNAGTTPLPMRLDSDTIRAGLALTGTVSGVGDRDIALFVINEDGRVYPIDAISRREGDTASIHTRISGGPPTLQPHLLMVLAAPQMPDAATDQRQVAANFFPALQSALAGREGELGAQLAYFKFGG